MELLEKQKVENVFNLFLEWNIGDVRKAGHWLPGTWESIDRKKISKIHSNYDGGAMVGSVILAMCVIQSIAQFSPERGDIKQFRWFVDTYLKPRNTNYDGLQIYALRCSLIKNYTLIARVSEVGKKNYNPALIPFALTDGGPHFKESNIGVLFNVKEFAIHVQLGIQSFFEDILLNRLSNEYLKSVVRYHDKMKIGSIDQDDKDLI